jgi:hypothetical protein
MNNAIIMKNPRGVWNVALVTPDHRTVGYDSFMTLRAAVNAVELLVVGKAWVRHHWSKRGPKWANTWHRVA